MGYCGLSNGVAGNGSYQRFVELATSQVYYMYSVLKSFGHDFYVLALVVLICVFTYNIGIQS